MSKNMNEEKNKLFCPQSMVRYDETACEYQTIWVCRVCTKLLLSENAVKMHLKICNTSTQPPETKKDEDNDTPTRHMLSSSEDSDSDQDESGPSTRE